LQNKAAQRFFVTPVFDQLLPAQLGQMIPNQELLIANLFRPSGTSWRASDRQGRDMLVKSVARQTESGRVIGWIVSIIDLSLVQAAQRQRDEALDFLSHDMRSPQSAILALLTLHQSAHPTQDSVYKILFDRIAAHAQRTLQLADDFVQLARANSATYQIEPVDLLDLVYEASDQFWEKAQLLKLNINTVSHLPDPDLAIYPVDRVMLGRALSNLIDNALKYGSSGERIDCSITQLDNAAIELAVQDYGVGIAPDQQGRLLSKFTQVGQRNQGVGLGLAFVRTVAEKHQGEVIIESAPGQGSRFSIVLPKVST
jgi:signal transduction histidine kinase